MIKHGLLFLLCLVTNCTGKQEVKAGIEYKFYVAGHVYGYPGESEANIGVHPPFKEKLGMIKDDQDILFGILTGDIVYNGALEKEWDELDADLAVTGKPAYFAPGNHDIANSKKRAIFTKRYGPSFQSFEQNGDLFFVLDPNIYGWSISGKQLSWLQTEIKEKGPGVRNVFVFFHQLLWWAKDNVFKTYPPNSPSGRADEINFFTEVLPLFSALNKPVYMFAGDTGVYERGLMYHKSENITFIASGMGGRVQDNFIITSVNTDGVVSFNLVSLVGDSIDSLGKLEDYVLPVEED
ncbi:metallophosphoesterase family protein [Ulvibacterium marinum]|uniref:metallophosphoesterase family protein n=1 Tax=Ulvibacterium marinum TaxID=2419782 RepID=UPI002493E7A4|nr:metallophosphoesterase [Ulvibacterium marinum]